jgi:hypothetical protein
MKYKKRQYKPRKKRPIFDRIVDRVKNMPLTKNGNYDYKQCWIWEGITNNAGYGMIKVGHSNINMATAHRVMHIEVNKAINYGDKVEVLHNCGNKECVNPKHLVTGNVKDRARLMKKHRTYNSLFSDKTRMWPVCEHCGEKSYLPWFKKQHSLCQYNAKTKYICESITGKTK